MKTDNQDGRAPTWDGRIRSIAQNIDNVIETGGNIRGFLTRRKDQKHFIQHMKHVPEDLPDEERCELGLFAYWNLKLRMDLCYNSKESDLNSESTPKKRVTRSTAKTIIEETLSPKQQLQTVVDNSELLEKILGGQLKKRLRLLVEEWEDAKPEFDGFIDGATPGKGGASIAVKQDQVIKTHHLRFAAFFYVAGPKALKAISDFDEADTSAIFRVVKFMVEKFEKVAMGVTPIFDAFGVYVPHFDEAKIGSSFSVVVPCGLKSDPDQIVAVIKFFLTEVDEVDQSITDINNEISLMHKAAQGQGSQFFIKPFDWNVHPIASFLVMENIAGGDLGDVINMRSMTPQRRLELFPVFAKTLAAGVVAIHDKRVVHRDIKLAVSMRTEVL